MMLKIGYDFENEVKLGIILKIWFHFERGGQKVVPRPSATTL
jgi:hypothetical protein